MSNFDFEEIEDDLDLIVPDIYRMFIQQVEQHDYDLQKHGIYHNTESLLKGNWHLRLHLADNDPPWKEHYLDFGVGDGSGNYFFLLATDETDDTVQLWAHDPPGIEEVSTGTVFFQNLLAEIANDFQGPRGYSYQGNGSWD